MVLFLCLLWTLFRGTLGGPVPRWDSKPTELHRLPVFLHASRPLVPPDLFRPAPGKDPLPSGLNALLVPPAEPGPKDPDRSVRAVEVRCGADTVSVRVDRLLLRAWTEPDRFRLGSCGARSVSSRYLDFSFSLRDCGADVQVVGGELVYTYLLSYTPPPQGHIIRVFPMNLPIHCRYNRFHYSYKVGFKPQVQQTTFLKGIESKLTFSLTVCDADWKPLPTGHTFSLGEPVYFLAQVRNLLAGERLYVDSCYATSSEELGSLPRVDIITNFGCMTDSWREGSGSRFLSGGSSVVKFSVDAFLFSGVSQVQYLHCLLSVGLSPSRTAKSCTYNKDAGRWEELMTSSSVCSCCGSVCADVETCKFWKRDLTAPDTLDPVKRNRVRSSGWSVDPKEDKKPEMGLRSFRAKEGGEPLSQEESWEADVEVHHKGVQTFLQAVRTDHKESDGEVESVVVGHQEKGGEMDVVTEKEGSKLESHFVMSDESRPQGNESGRAWDQDELLPVLSDHSRRTNTSLGGSVSTAGIPVCPDGSCSGISGANGGPGTGYGSAGTEHFRTFNVSRSVSSAFLHLVSEGGPPEPAEVETVPGPKRVMCERATGLGSNNRGDDLRVRGLESGSRDPICNDNGESGFDSGALSEVLRQNQSTGEAEPAGSLSETKHGPSRSHAAFVTVTSLRGSEGDPQMVKQWEELVPEWVLEHLAVLVKQPVHGGS